MTSYWQPKFQLEVLDRSRRRLARDEHLDLSHGDVEHELLVDGLSALEDVRSGLSGPKINIAK